ncbi:MAG: hypothetical protein CBD29_02260 [Synechococcus sp. TMED169]|nr:MAG: hypothetical protein CBD29_02260 [Synechococcus sp. TMED169]
MSECFPTLLLIPTGIGCEQGGFAGDALPVARLLAAASDCLITHPNVMNGAALYWSDPRIHYVEGWSLDAFSKGLLRLRPQRRQHIGVLLDAGIEPELLLRHHQVLAAARATLGLDIGPVLVSEEPLGVRLSQASSGSSWGHLEQPGALLRAGARLKQEGATAIAVVARFPDDSGSDALQAYRSGSGVDALAGAEAVISHLLVRELQIPCAHAPALAPLAPMADLDPRAAAEELGHTFIPCVLVGLSRAPDLCSASEPWRPQELAIDQVGAVVAPAGALGGETVLACADRGIPIVAVSSNPSLLQVDASALDLPVVKAQDYAAAAGLVLAWREGLDPRALARPLSVS